MQITNEHLAFMQAAKTAFEQNDKQLTFRDDIYIALRYGADNDCIRIFELGPEVAFFANVIGTKLRIEGVDE